MKDITVLKSAVGSNVSPGALACLRNVRERKIKIVGTDAYYDPSIKYLVDSYYNVPKITDPTYCDVMLDICEKEQVDIYLPGISAELNVLSRREKDFKNIGTIVSIPNLNTVKIANNKLLTYETLKKYNIPIPNYHPVHCVGDFIEGCKALGYPDKPVCLKIVNGSGSRGVRIIDPKKSRYKLFVEEKPSNLFASYEDIIEILSEAEFLDEMMLLDYMPGNEYTVDLLADKGQVIYMAGRDNYVSQMSIAQESVLNPNEHAYVVSKKIVEVLNMDGNVGFDFMKDGNGVPVLMDINPRLTATVSIAAAGGLNLQYMRIKQLLNEPLPKIDIKYGIRLRRRYIDLFTGPNGEYIPSDVYYSV